MQPIRGGSSDVVKDLVCFFGIQYRVGDSLVVASDASGDPRSCASSICAALVWIAQVRELAAGISRAANGERASVHLFTSCLTAATGAALSADGGPHVRTEGP